MRYKSKLVHIVITIVFCVILNSDNGLISATTIESQSLSENVLATKIKGYSFKSENVTFLSSTYYNSKGMSPLYSITNKFLDIVVGENLIPDGYIEFVNITDVKFGPKYVEQDWGDILKTYWAMILIVLVTGLIIVLMPIIGLCFCCCRCAGSCGGRTQPFDKKHDGCRRAFWGLLLVFTTSALIFGVVAAFVTNKYMEDGVQNITTSAFISVNDTQLYLNKTCNEFDNVLISNYDILSKNLKMILETASQSLIKEFEDKSKAIKLIELSNFVYSLPDVQKDLNKTKTLTRNLRVRASQLNDGLRGVKRELLNTLSKCQRNECQDILTKYHIGQLDTNGIDYNKLPDDMINEVMSAIDELNIREAFDEGMKQINNINKTITDKINTHLPKIKTSLDNAGDELKKQSNEMTSTITNLSNDIGHTSKTQLKQMDSYVKDYAHYRYWFGLGISSVLLLIVACLICGLLCGICGRRPSGYGDDCCNKGAGSSFLMCGVAFIFLTISALAIICLVYFLLGFIAHRAICEPLRQPSVDPLFKKYIDNLIDLNGIMNENHLVKSYQKSNFIKKSSQLKSRVNEKVPMTFSEIIMKCHYNESIYNVLNLQNIIKLEDIQNYIEEFEIKKKMEDMIQSLNINEIEFPSDLNDNINKLKNSKLSTFSSTKYQDELKVNFTKYNLTEIASELNRTADRIKEQKTEDTSIKTTLRTQALHLEIYQQRLVEPMIADTEQILNISETLDTKLKFNHSSFTEAMDEMIKEIHEAQETINKNGTALIKQISEEMLNLFTNEIQKYLGMVESKIIEDVGACYPISTVYNATLIATCNSVIDPMNGFWAALSWCIGLFLIAIIFSAKLSTLYQKTNPYPGPFVEAEYLYDAYSERDNIPLASGSKNKRRNKYERRRNSREHRDYYEDSSSSHGPINGGPPREARYNDMAPKHWEGGPPRYQSPPIAPPDPEYERPPPYYYPGAPAQE